MKKILVLLLVCTISQLRAQVALAPYVILPAGAAASLVKIADINGDGLKDVVVADGFYFNPATDGSLLIFLQDSSGGLGTPIVTYYGDGGSSAGMGMDAFDFDGDGLSDIVMGFGDSVKVLKSNGDGTFQMQLAINSGHGVDGVSIGDLDGDGHRDIAISHWNSAYIRILWGGGAFQFSQQTYATPNSGYDQILAAKIAQDTVASLIYMRGQNSGAPIKIYKFNSSRVITDSIIINNIGSTSFLPQPHSIAVADRQGDGYNELGVVWGGNQPNSGISFFDNVNAAAPSQVTATIDIPGAVVAANLDCRSGDEYIIAHDGWTKLSVVSKDTTLTFFMPYNSIQPQGIDVGDINNDGYKDIVVAGFNSGLVIFYNQSGMNGSVDSSRTTICSNDSVQLCAPQGTNYVWSNGSTQQCFYANQQSFYSGIFTNQSGCSVRIDSVFLTVHQAPHVSDIVSLDTIRASGGGSYSWFRNNIRLQGDTSAVFIASSSGEYYVMVTDTNMCSATSTPVQITIADIPVIGKNESFEFYPNPMTDGILQLEVKELPDGTPLEIFDIDGKVVFSILLKGTNTVLNLNQLSAGSYMVKVNDTTRQLVIQ